MKYFHPRKIWRVTKELTHDFFWYYLLSDSLYLQIRYKEVFGEALNINHPQKFSEKIQWLKLYDRRDIYHKLVDKYEVKPIIANIIGEEFIIKTLGVWNKYEDIDFEHLPNRFILKCTHDSASVTVCLDKNTFNKDEHAWKYDDVFMKRDYYHYLNKQWVYKGLKPKIIAEEFLEDDKYDSLADYKLYCCNGEAKCVYVTINRFTELRVNVYDMEWNRMPLEHIHESTPDPIAKPKNLGLMQTLAEKIARFVDNPFVRVDFYEVKGKVYFGEVTFYPEGGMGYFDPPEWDYIFGSWIDLSRGAR
ncbi:MAG: ATP-grasp fold amidoligase family protein [Lachnospira sp.]